jgi:anion-transporting  ArsA/GET3 family ATPase
LVDLLERKLIFVTGKGGVGKTSIAAALAWLAASRGLRTLVCEVDAKGNLADFFETGPIGFEERQIVPDLWAMSMDTEASLKQYLSLQLRLPLVARVGPLAKMFDFVATAAPGVKEIVTVGKLCWEVKAHHYDIVIVDSSASGHIVGQLAAPQAINQLVQGGLVRQQTGWMLEILDDPAVTGLVVAATPAEMPVSETLELIGRLGAETNVDLAAVVVNRVLPELFGRDEEQVFARLATASAKARLEAVLGGATGSIMEAARLTVSMRRSRTDYLDALRTAVDATVPLLYLPYLFFRSHGLRATHQLADALAGELGY